MKNLLIALAIFLAGVSTTYAVGIKFIKDTTVTVYNSSYLNERGVTAYSFNDGSQYCYVVEQSSNKGIGISCPSR